jgi:hypothetical protein
MRDEGMIHEVGPDKGFGYFVSARSDGAGGLDVEIAVPEASAPEAPAPWFEIEYRGARFRGQATTPPRMLGSGKVLYRLKMHHHGAPD